ncbi:HAD family hydrolase [Jonesia denitrificans]|uniref:HAD-superfamily hydrolase, subfamily IIB n=1 Tax=Jonesia denitrificans (strain ATCC 14870 / DSM 20603 / BCRC 15368 / CIP 55.134 / JCM 11481 / NBRC 15587 / NCTC 10816 / Prevot 55134) TaxID=471856 RepID=C7QZ32_JONDD|nr:HAD family hydrolase [Jonesia denitrificans]ACV07940.1 HAD-superfamily hydrolase, subfamily IIB [Jonesia denitrificans DSM 20603]ASE08364.1 HAD family phosphatase [Jonesia denitrificans]QXB42965.1 Cof-type HAD-IIB family hydrolase [Jonesia denitrificans]SQH19913.1 Phosphatase YidA [Jonesia denitrificans]
MTPAPMLIGLDIDGTIMTADEFISSAVREAITELRLRGHHVVLATGRPLVAVLPVLKDLGIDSGWAVCSNGSVTARLDASGPGAYELDDVVEFPAGPAVDALDAHLPHAVIGLENIGVGYSISADFGSPRLHGSHIITPVAALRAMRTPRVVVARAQHPPAQFRADVAAVDLADSYYSIADEHWMDLAPAGITKAYGLDRLRARLGIPTSATVAVGDADNDIDMLQWAGHGVAMGHAAADVIAAADDVTWPITDDGLAPVLQSLLS